jgi:hypothetical protein
MIKVVTIISFIYGRVVGKNRMEREQEGEKKRA